MRELELYIHIPFCVRKCAYCDFLSFPARREQRDRYMQALLEEIRGGSPMNAPLRLSETEEYVVTSVFWGGGTPSLLPVSQIEEIMEALRRRFRFSDDAEITLECNPGTVEETLTRGQGVAAGPSERSGLAALRDCGINRLSFGLQSADNAELAALGRIHTWETFLRSYESARNAGFTNINIDLMSALPGQTVTSWEKTLERILPLAPEHISAYSLIIEEGTPFYQKYHEDDRKRSNGEEPDVLPSEEAERRMYARTEEMLNAAGFCHYEISNYALPGCACRHNIGYWRGVEYMGFGLGASSFLKYSGESCRLMPERTRCQIENQCCWKETGNGHPSAVREEQRLVSVRFQNPVGFAEYERHARNEDYEILTVENEMEEFMFLGLHMLSGISEREFARRFHCSVDSVYGGTIERLLALELLRREEGRIFLTPRGIDLSNGVMAEFLLS